jgi:hypothetical protein
VITDINGFDKNENEAQQKIKITLRVANAYFYFSR